MNEEEFGKLPIGTVLMWYCGTYNTIEIKKSKDKLLQVWNNDDGSVCFENMVISIYEYDVAPKWIQELFEVLK